MSDTEAICLCIVAVFCISALAALAVFCITGLARR